VPADALRSDAGLRNLSGIRDRAAKGSGFERPPASTKACIRLFVSQPLPGIPILHQ